ncbi:MAG: Fic family protein [Spirochaetaceae bacterium]
MITSGNQFSRPVTVFHGLRLPEEAIPAGYAALIDCFDLRVPLPRTLFAVSTRHHASTSDRWRVLSARYRPEPTLSGHLTFALKYEGVDLAVLARLFAATGTEPVEQLIQKAPTGSYSRRIWFLYEWLTGHRLNLDNAEQGNYVDALDTRLQYGASLSEKSPRHRVRNNLPGTPGYCPLVFRTERLDAFRTRDLATEVRDKVAQVPKDVVARAASFLLLRDSRSSYEIEGEHPPEDRIRRWSRALSEAGTHELDANELVRLQGIVVGDPRFVRTGFRQEGGFVGEHDRDTGVPLPDHISARPEDLPSLISGLVTYAQTAAGHVDPVIAAATVAFGFVYIHPFQDGNGRVHRYLIHHVLATAGFNPPGLVFPISSTILSRMDEYRRVLESYSDRLLPCITWEATEDHNVRVKNDTADFYRFFDATPHAEFIYSCVAHTIEHDLPEETRFLQRYDGFRNRLQSIVDMPDRTINLLFRFLRQNQGRLSKRSRQKEFAALSDEEVARVESFYAEAFPDQEH